MAHSTAATADRVSHAHCVASTASQRRHPTGCMLLCKTPTKSACHNEPVMPTKPCKSRMYMGPFVASKSRFEHQPLHGTLNCLCWLLAHLPPSGRVSKHHQIAPWPTAPPAWLGQPPHVQHAQQATHYPTDSVSSVSAARGCPCWCHDRVLGRVDPLCCMS